MEQEQMGEKKDKSGKEDKLTAGKGNYEHTHGEVDKNTYGTVLLFLELLSQEEL
jgi:hypothetical protein